MPTTEFSFKDLSRLLGKKYQPREIRDKISMLGVDIETINEEAVVMEVFPNRPDMLGVEGFARAFKGVLGVETGLPAYETESSGVKLYVDSSVRKVRPYVSAGIVRGVSLDEESLASLMNVQEKLHITHGRNRKKVAIGVHDLSKVMGPFLYTAVKPSEISFVPLDMTESMDLARVLERHPKGRAYAWTLEGMEKYPVILDRNKNVLSFPPVINGNLTRISEKTHELFIDVTGTERKAVDQALNMLVTSILDRCGKAYTVEILEK